ncbi:MAG: Type 1 glutamine amidotransferase-like domain-containing protein [Anaerolineales bacterium]|nr:Type 1 glutamine amidotransferase-like domain-containing protein [Anaerolineales bacterium]
MSRQLFLLGGSAAFDVAANEFVPASGGRNARIALLLQGGRDWQKYVPEYTRAWKSRGVSRYDVIVPDDAGRLNSDDVAAKLANATGIFIGGGHTATYRRLYATEPVRAVLRERYARGIPIAGCSAGALIAPRVCAFHPGEEESGARVAEGLGLLDDLLVGVHFAAENALQHLLDAMVSARVRRAWGIDDGACVVLENEKFTRVLGRAAYEIVMTDFSNRLYHSLEHPIP